MLKPCTETEPLLTLECAPWAPGGAHGAMRMPMAWTRGVVRCALVRYDATIYIRAFLFDATRTTTVVSAQCSVDSDTGTPGGHDSLQSAPPSQLALVLGAGYCTAYRLASSHLLRHALFGVLSDVDSGRAFGDDVEATAETSC